MKICGVCKIEKPLDEFHNKSNSRDGKQAQCKDCNRVRSNKWRSENKSKAAVAMGNYRQTLEGCIRERFHNAHHRARDKDYEFNISVEFLIKLFNDQKGLCALSGYEMNYISGSSYKMSLDRIDSSKGYTIDNVQWITWQVNNLKGNLEESELFKLCEAICTRKGSETIREEYTASAVEAPNP